MKRFLLHFLCVAFVCLPGVSWAETPSDDQPELHWHYVYEEAIAEARASGKPLFLEFRCAP